MSMNFVNLDEMASVVTKSIEWNGEKHEIKELTVGSFKKAMELQETFESMKDDAPEADVIDAYIEMCALTIPTITAEEVRGWNMTQMMAVVQVITYVATEDAPDEDEVEAAEAMGKSPAEAKTK